MKYITGGFVGEEEAGMRLFQVSGHMGVTWGSHGAHMGSHGGHMGVT